MPTRSRKLAIWRALPPYLGGKRRLVGHIFREIDRVVPRRLWGKLTLLDGFLGGGAVSLYAKAQGFAVIATDIAERSVIVGQALIQNSRVTLTHEDILRVAAPSDGPPGRVEQNHAPNTFTAAQARVLDRTLVVAGETRDVAKAALLRLLAIRVMLLAHPMSQVRGGNMGKVAKGEFDSITQSCLPNYVDGLRLTRVDRLWQLAQQINAGVFHGEARVMKTDILGVLPDIPGHVFYMDPPYPSTSSYEREYKVIDEILEGESLPVSPFSRKDGAALLDRVFEKATHIPVWVLSLGNATVSIEELEAKMRIHGREVRSTSIQYAHKASLAAKESRERNREFILVAWDPEAALMQSLSPGMRQRQGEEVH
ncbi:MAG: DNA adenine methylase [Candidatus Eisenbacteria sp.]|nr:DNA adenine methylase [Candidatus Eisenbacteria bacterium]